MRFLKFMCIWKLNWAIATFIHTIDGTLVVNVCNYNIDAYIYVLGYYKFIQPANKSHCKMCNIDTVYSGNNYIC